MIDYEKGSLGGIVLLQMFLDKLKAIKTMIFRQVKTCPPSAK